MKQRWIRPSRWTSGRDATAETLIKQRIEAAEAFRKAGRVEQAEKEEAERALIESYLPAAATEQEVEAAVAEALARPARLRPSRWAW